MRTALALTLLAWPAAAAAQAPSPAPVGEAVSGASAPAPAGSRIYSGLANRLDIDLPRAPATTVVVVDGVLDEPVWQTAALLTGFSQFEPQDGLPAADSTEVLVWYSDHAIFFGIRAFEPHGAVQSKLADRDKIDTDDHVMIFLDTFNDRRRALYFAVNAIGRQADGIWNDRGSGSHADLAEDFQFQSKGRVTDYGYEVEIRLPFKSLRYQSVPVQDWGIQVMREVQHSQHAQTWTPAKKASQSFLGQSGKLKGLTQLKRGLVMDLNPVSTSHVDGTTPGASTRWNFSAAEPEFGGNVRWGITTNLTLNATANPDFSQVEADVQQVQYDPRSAVSFPEKRPFFVEGSEQFDAPHNLIYTRRMVQPVAALKLNGKAVGANIGLLSAVDQETPTGTPGDSAYPVFNILRLKRDVGPQSTIAITATDRTNGSNWSRVASGDMRLVFLKNLAFTGSYAHSFNHNVNRPVVNTNAPIWRFNLDRTGRRYSSSYNVQGTHPLFETTAGFVSRTNIASASMDQRFTTFGKPGSILESHTFTFNVSSTWWYDSLLHLKEWNDPKLHLNNSFAFKGGWRATTNVFIETFRYDPNLYRNYYIERTLAGGTKDTVPYVGVHRIFNVDISQSFNTPQFSTFRGSFNIIWGRDENFEEWSPAWILFPTFTLTWNPISKIRSEFRYPLQLYVRMSDNTTVKRRQIPRLKVEYQASRAVFFRFVGQYDAQFRDSLRDDSRTNFPVLIRSGNTYTRNTLVRRNDLRVDWLFSYQPAPGTVFFAGYGASLREPDAFRFTDLNRTGDGFFVKLSYLYRL